MEGTPQASTRECGSSHEGPRVGKDCLAPWESPRPANGTVSGAPGERTFLVIRKGEGPRHAREPTRKQEVQDPR